MVWARWGRRHRVKRRAWSCLDSCNNLRFLFLARGAVVDLDLFGSQIFGPGFGISSLLVSQLTQQDQRGDQ